MVVEVDILGEGSAPYYPGTLALAVKAYEKRGILWPVSGDRLAVDPDYLVRRDRDMQARRPARHVVAAGRLRRPADPNRVQCLDCPWGLTVQGWDSGAYKLAHRHAAARGHRVDTWSGGK